MKNNFFNKYALIAVFGFCWSTTFGHDVPVHRAISANAEASAFNDSSGYTNYLNVVSSDFSSINASNYIVEGSAREDDPVAPNPPIDGPGGGYRSLNHFYDPIYAAYGRGLSDFPPDIRVLEGISSFSWASIYNSPGISANGLNPKNIWSWQNARNYEWLGLTSSAQPDRIVGLTNMFRAVGQVMHLLEDTSQPQHVRNEQHLDKFPFVRINTPWRSPIEDYGFANVANLNYKQSMLDWRGAGFTKLEDFWDRHLYNGTSSQPLIDSEDPTKPTSTLGLAEWCNGNFLGARHLYAEYYDKSDIRYYPFPSRNASTDYPQKFANLVAGIHSLPLKNGQEIQAVYLDKTGAGVHFPYHSRFNYFGAKFPHVGMGVTINDTNVLASYHNVLIPKAVNYSAGLLDYYFRGNLGIEMTPTYNSSGPTYQLTITNISGQDFKGGTFQLFYDDDSGTRTPLTSSSSDGSFQITWDSINGALADKATITAFLTPPSTINVKNYILVYQGTIGTTANQPSDDVDSGIAIAAKSFLPCSWWKMEETSGDRIDSVEGVHLKPNTYNTGGTVSAVPGVIGNAVELSFNAGEHIDLNNYPGTPATGLGATWCGWWKNSGPFGQNVYFTIYFTSSSETMELTGNGTSLDMHPQGTIITTVSLPASGVWHFFLVEFDYSTGTWKLQFDDSGSVYIANGTPPTYLDDILFGVSCQSGVAGTSLTADFDEVGVLPIILTQAQKDYLYNSGNGRTWPIQLP